MFLVRGGHKGRGRCKRDEYLGVGKFGGGTGLVIGRWVT